MSLPGTVSSIAEGLAAIPAEADATLIIRHAEREEIPSGEFGVDVPLTARGAAEAELLGKMLRSARDRFAVVSSPVPRCVQTAEAVLRGGGCPTPVTPDRRLGDPGPFVVDTDVAGQLFLEFSIPELVRRQLHDPEPPPGMRPTADGVGIILSLAASSLANLGRLSVYVTHDAILAVVVASLFRLPLEEVGWPDYLEGLLLWRSDRRLHLSWRGLGTTSPPPRGRTSQLWTRRQDG